MRRIKVISRRKEAGFAKDLFKRVVEAIVKALLMFGYRAPGKIIGLVKTIIYAMVGKGNVSGTLKMIVKSLKNKGIFRSIMDLDLNLMGMVDDIVHEFIKTKKSSKKGSFKMRREGKETRDSKNDSQDTRKLRLALSLSDKKRSKIAIQGESEFEEDMDFDESVHKLEEWKKIDKEVFAKILEANREFNVEGHDWSEPTIANFIADEEKKMGYEPEDVLFSGFWSQGDGASFIGDLDTEAVVNFIETFKLKEFDDLVKLAKAGVAYLGLNMSRTSSHNVHEMSVQTDAELIVDSNDDDEIFEALKIIAPQLNLFEDAQRDPGEILEEYLDSKYSSLEDAWDEKYRIPKCTELYQNLSEEYDYQTSDEILEETLGDEEYDFDSEGDRV